MKIYLVGGAIRDEIIGIPSKEKDWVVVGATPEKMIADGFIPVGKHFPVFIHPDTGEEYALARTERKIAPGYHGFDFNASPEVTLKEDLQRRDLTINAIARSDDGQLIDPWNGLEDIEHKKLCHISPAFGEDPVRILRVARFYSKFHHLGFTIDDATLQLLKQMVISGEADALVEERVWLETYKALQTKHPTLFFNVLHQIDLIDRIFPEMSFIATSNDNVFAQCVNEHAKEQTPQTLFALLAHIASLNNQSLTPLCKRLKLSQKYNHIATLADRISKRLIQTEKYTEKDLLHIIQSSDALRKTDAFTDFLHACLLYSNAIEKNVSHLNKAVDTLKSIDFKKHLANQPSAKDLPQYIEEIRLSVLKGI